jgi:hypothetical protein
MNRLMNAIPRCAGGRLLKLWKSLIFFVELLNSLSKQKFFRGQGGGFLKKPPGFPSFIFSSSTIIFVKNATKRQGALPHLYL